MIDTPVCDNARMVLTIMDETAAFEKKRKAT